MPNLPMIHVGEWKKLEPLLPLAGGPGKPRSDDRLMVSAFFYAEACKCSDPCRPVMATREACAPGGCAGNATARWRN